MIVWIRNIVIIFVLLSIAYTVLSIRARMVQRAKLAAEYTARQIPQKKPSEKPSENSSENSSGKPTKRRLKKWQKRRSKKQSEKSTEKLENTTVSKKEFIARGMQIYGKSYRPKLIFGVYLVPIAVMAVLIYLAQYS